jgi:hypothetical protein
MRLQEQGKTEQARKDLGNSFEIKISLAFVFLMVNELYKVCL